MSKILIAAYHPIVLKGISEIISEKLPDSQIIATATHAKTFLSLLKIHKPDVAVIDVAVTWKSDVDLLDEINSIHPKIKLHFLSVHPFDHTVQKYLLKKAEKKFSYQEAEFTPPIHKSADFSFKKKSISD